MMSYQRAPVVLFLVADTGGGHRSAANAIRAAMNLIAPESIKNSNASEPPLQLPFSPQAFLPPSWNAVLRPWRAEVHDIFEECGMAPLRRTARMYGPTVERTPRVYASFYHASNTRATYAAISALTQQMLRQGLKEMIRELRPDVIVSVHSLLTKSTWNMTQSLGVQIPYITVVTDLIRFHRAWAFPKVDVCVAPTEEAKQQLIGFGMPEEKIQLLGMPIHPKFAIAPNEIASQRKALGLREDVFTILLVGGGDGVGGLKDIAHAFTHSHLPLQMIVVTGRNEALRRQLTEESAQFPFPSAILGFVDNMPDLMRASDVIVTKAGPGTIMEALSCGLPIILTSAIPGQEVGNIDFVVQHNVGVYAPELSDMVSHVHRLIALNASQREEISQRACALSSAQASFAIAKLILQYVPAPRSISLWNRSLYAAGKTVRSAKRRDKQQKINMRLLSRSSLYLRRRLRLFNKITQRRHNAGDNRG